MAVLPVDAVGVPPDEGVSIQRSLQQAIQRRETAQNSLSLPLDQFLAQRKTNLAQCQSSNPCLTAVGRQLQADLLLFVAMAGLGEVRLMRSQLFAVDQGIVLRDIQETTGRAPHQLATYVDELTRRLFPDPVRRPWYKKWWIWTATAIAVGATMGLTWYATRSTPRDEEGIVHLGDLP